MENPPFSGKAEWVSSEQQSCIIYWRSVRASQSSCLNALTAAIHSNMPSISYASTSAGRQLEDWAQLLLSFAQSTGMNDLVMTVDEISSGIETQGTGRQCCPIPSGRPPCAVSMWLYARASQ